MRDLQHVVAAYVDELAGPRADDACHSLLELGVDALPFLANAFRLARNQSIRRRIAEIVGHLRSMDALPLLSEFLDDKSPDIWKAALDGLVILGDEPAARPVVHETLVDARHSADVEKQAWIDEAVNQVLGVDEHA